MYDTFSPCCKNSDALQCKDKIVPADSMCAMLCQQIMKRAVVATSRVRRLDGGPNSLGCSQARAMLRKWSTTAVLLTFSMQACNLTLALTGACTQCTCGGPLSMGMTTIMGACIPCVVLHICKCISATQVADAHPQAALLTVHEEALVLIRVPPTPGHGQPAAGRQRKMHAPAVHHPGGVCRGLDRPLLG